MLKTRLKSISLLLIISTLCTCIDPYVPKISGYESVLVVEGLITDESAAYEVKLTRAMENEDAVPDPVTDAVVSFTDESDNKTTLEYTGNGIYKTDPATFKGEIGKTYTLHIIASDGNEFVSEPCTMLPVPDIDSVYYQKDVELSDNNTENLEGIGVYIDSKQADDNTYYRWGFEETWKFRIPTPKKYIFVNKDSIVPINDVREFCWKQQETTQILINSVYSAGTNVLKKQPVTFIAPEKSDRLTIQYSILVKQYSISQKEFEFWEDLKKVNEINGDIFGIQPFLVTSNISAVGNPGDKVLGYFHVSAVRQKRLTVTFNELLPLNLPLYHYDCERIQTEPSDYCRGGGYCIPPTWDELNRMWTDKHFTFVEPYYSDPIRKKLGKLIFTTPECAECELTGTSIKPDFWVDLE